MSTLPEPDRRFSVAPMMEWTESYFVSMGYGATCAMRVHS